MDWADCWMSSQTYRLVYAWGVRRRRTQTETRLEVWWVLMTLATLAYVLVSSIRCLSSTPTLPDMATRGPLMSCREASRHRIQRPTVSSSSA